MRQRERERERERDITLPTLFLYPPSRRPDPQTPPHPSWYDPAGSPVLSVVRNSFSLHDIESYHSTGYCSQSHNGNQHAATTRSLRLWRLFMGGLRLCRLCAGTRGFAVGERWAVIRSGTIPASRWLRDGRTLGIPRLRVQLLSEEPRGGDCCLGRGARRGRLLFLRWWRGCVGRVR